MSKTNIDGEVKLSFTEILFSPILALWNMAKSEDEVEDDIKLDKKSPDKVISDLAKSQDEIENEVNAKYGKEIKKSKEDVLNDAKLSRKQWKVKDIDSTKVVSNHNTRNQHTEQIEQEEDKTR